MKIRQIKFSNINNLKGEHEINFGAAPLSTAGIFAITGPTGSGKSTILDVITLALFNRIPRFKASISKGKIQEFGSILTHHTTEATASIEYEIKGQIYVSSWSVAKTRNNTLKDYEMSLMDSSGSYLDLKKSEVPDKNAEIIGLEYEQFVKSIILSQGQFSRFLKADKNERGQLLENLTGTSVYRKIGIRAFQKFKDFNDQARLEKEKLEDIELLTGEARTTITEAIEKADQDLEVLSKELKKQDELIAIKTDLQAIARELEKTVAEKAELAQKTEQSRADEVRLAKHEKLGGLQGDLKLYLKAKTDSTLLKEQLSTVQAQLQKAKDNVQALLNEVAILTGEQLTPAEVAKQLNQFENEVLELDRIKTEKRQQGVDQRQMVNRKAIHYHVAIHEKIAPKAALELLQKDQLELTKHIKEAGLTHEASIAESKSSLKAKQEELTLLKELMQILLEEEKESKSAASNQEALARINTQLNELAPLIGKSEKLIEQLKENETLLRKQKEDALKIADLESLRADLEEGEPCPLCGAVHHPYAAHAPGDHRSELDVKIEKAQQDLHEETQTLTQEKDKRTRLSTQQQLISANLEQQQRTIGELNAKRVALSENYKGNEVLTFDSLNSRIPLLTSQNQLLEKGIESLEQININTELAQGFELFEQLLSDFEKANKERSQKYAGTDIKAHTEQLRNNFQSAQDKSLTLSTESGNIAQQLTQAMADLEGLGKKLQPIAQSEGFASIEALNSQLLTESEVIRIREDKEKLQNALATNRANQQRLEERQAQQKAQDTEREISLMELQQAKAENLQRQVDLGEQRGANRKSLEQDDQNKEKLANKAELLDKLESELKKWSLLNKMIGDANGHKFSNFAQGITLQNLLVYANKRLQKLSDRYLLIKPEGEGTLKVLDQYQGNSERSVATLSGGETFLLSLALALSLSDMASKNVSLDSLFIDEGFGTLDQETLDIAMNTLERLQSESQKTVGVISHVEALKERITVQVKLEKNALGYSQIKVEG